MATKSALVTGFEPYAGRTLNPASEVARAFAGRQIEGTPVEVRLLPVSYGQLRSRINDILRELDPLVVISLGLWPGEPLIRIERLGVNVADFEVPDNDGAVVTDQLVGANGPTAFSATLPIRQIENALLNAGIPARLSSTAGTFLCNACLYSFLESIAASGRHALCGFIHLPYFPSQIAELLKATRKEARLELHQRSDLASMDASMATRAIELALAASIAAARQATM